MGSSGRPLAKLLEEDTRRQKKKKKKKKKKTFKMLFINLD